MGDYMKKLIFSVTSVICSFCVFIFSVISVQNISISASNAKGISETEPVIIIDAGHGGFDGGAVTADGYPEKNINLKISLYLNEYLKKYGFKTIMTRTKDISLEDEGLTTIKSKKTSDIHNRMKIMEETDNAIFVSIHQNYFTQSKYSGFQVFYSPNLKDESYALAQEIRNCVIENLQPDNTRLSKECGSSVYLMYNAVKPAVLVECGFLSNKEEAEKLKQTDYQKEMALNIAKGIKNYFSSKTD